MARREVVDLTVSDGEEEEERVRRPAQAVGRRASAPASFVVDLTGDDEDDDKVKNKVRFTRQERGTTGSRVRREGRVSSLQTRSPPPLPRPPSIFCLPALA